MSFKVIGVGEALFDLLPSGPRIGGAPTNFACHARALGADACVITRVGKDDYGQAILRFLEKMQIAGETQVDVVAPTGTVTVTLSGQGVPHFIIHENVAWDRLESTSMARAVVRHADAICFGSLAQRNETARLAIQKLVASTPRSSLRVFDINLRQSYFSREIIERSLQLANVLKLNEDELEILAPMFDLSGTLQNRMERLAQNFDLRLVALTRGAQGSVLFQDGQWSDRRSVPVKIVDTVGAGDAFTAALVLGLLQKMELDRINQLATEVAAYVCSCAGATPVLPRSFSEKFAVNSDLRR